jgi:hypothetical protein
MGSSPRPPDPYATAQAQGSANFTNAQQNAIMGNVNEYTPYGSKTYQQIGWDPVYDAQGKMTYAPRYQSQVQYSPDQQRLLAQQTGTEYNLGNLALGQSSRLGGLLGHEMDTSSLTPWANYRRDESATDRPAVEKALMSRWNEDTAQKNAQQDVNYSLRGLNPGSQGYGDVQQSRDRARTDAVNQAYLQSGNEARAQQEAYNAATSNMNNLRGAQFQETTALRNQPINEIMALLGGSGVTTPTFQPFAAPSTQPVNVAQNIYDNYNTQAQQAAANRQGLFGLAGAGLSAALMPMGGAGGFGGTLLGSMLGRR